MAAREPDQALRLAAFRDAHPGVEPREAAFGGACEAWLPAPDGGRLIVGHTLRDLLDKLDDALGGAPGSRPGPSTPPGPAGRQSP